MKNNLFRLIILMLLSLSIIGCGASPASSEPKVSPQPLLNINDDVVSASAEVVAEKWANLAFLIGAEEVEVKVRVGDHVKEGDILMVIPEDSLPQSVINAQADLILAQKSLDDVLNADTALAQAVIALRDAQKAYDNSFDDRDELNYLITYKETVIKKDKTPYGIIEIPTIKEYKAYADETTIAKADEDLALKKALLEDAQEQLDQLLNLENSPEVLAAQTRIKAIESFLEQSMLKAPFNGTIVEMYVNSGELVSPGVPVLLLADFSTLQVKTTDLNEVDVAQIHVGDIVDISFDALPDKVVTGKISEISLKNTGGSGVYYDVFIMLDEIPDELRWGMSAFVEIQTSK